MAELTKRKPNRLNQYDYSTPGAYFITICTKNKEKILSTVGATIGRPLIRLTEYGKMIDKAIKTIEKVYPFVTVDQYVIMPNHIHLLLQIHTDENGRPMVAPTIGRVIQQMKGYATKQIGKNIWQKLYHDHIIRNQNDYDRIWNYIELNPMYWKKDCFYIE